MANPVDLEPQAKAVVDANAAPPYLFELGPDQVAGPSMNSRPARSRS